jgi:ubiquinone/menaquinone biosynthesis C-methylase UbiE
MAGLSRIAPSSQPRAQKAFWRVVYGLSTRRADGAADAFMNYGYAPMTNANGSASRAPGRDGIAFGTALYDRVVSATDLAGKDVLEVGCGRGGGTVHVFESHAPRSMVGVDLTPEAITYCQERFARPGLRFLVADAEDLPFPDGSFDVVLNVESCHCYPDVPRFLEAAHRVLRPGGLFLLADVRHTSLARTVVGGPLHHEDVDDFRGQIQASSFTILEEEDVTPNVARALQLDSARRRAVVEDRVPRLLQPQALNFAGVEGTPLHDAYVGGDMTYLRMVLQKGVGP